MTEQQPVQTTNHTAHTEQLYEALQQSMDAHASDELHEIEHEDMEHFGQSLTDLSPLPLRRP
jgi:hypothetical protein